MIYSYGIFSKYKLELYGFSMIWIILYHGNYLKEAPNGSLITELLSNFLSYGNCGVDLFLFLSGIFCFFSFTKNNDIKQFYKKRIIRIYFPVLIIYGFYWIYDCILRKHSLILFIQKITASYFWVTGERSIWFIALIVPLYIFYPLIYNKILIKYNVRKIWLIMFGISALIFLCSYLGKIYFFSHYKLYEIAITRIPVFLLGCSLGKYVYGNKVINKYVLVISLLVAFAGVSGFLCEKIDVISTLRIPYLLIAPCLALWLCILLDKIKLTIFNQILSLFGEVSLELYLSHLVIREIARRIHLWDTNNFLNFCKYVFFVALASYTVSKIVSILFYYLMKRKKLEVRCRQ